LVCAIEGGLDTERGECPLVYPGNPEDLVAHVRQRGCMQRIVIVPEHGYDIPAVTQDVRHRLCRRLESGPCPGGELARGYRRRAVPGGRLRGISCLSGGAARRGNDCQQYQRYVPPHEDKRTPWALQADWCQRRRSAHRRPRSTWPRRRIRTDSLEASASRPQSRSSRAIWVRWPRRLTHRATSMAFRPPSLRVISAAGPVSVTRSRRTRDRRSRHRAGSSRRAEVASSARRRTSLRSMPRVASRSPSCRRGVWAPSWARTMAAVTPRSTGLVRGWLSASARRR